MEKEKKKKNKDLIVIIILLIIIILGLVGFILYDKGIILNNNKEEKKTKKEIVKKKEVEKENLSQEEIDTLETYVKDLTNSFAKYYPLEDLNKIDNQDLLMFALSKVGWNETINADEMDKQIQAYFGDYIKLKRENIKCPMETDNEPLFLYKDGKYVTNPNHGGHGGVGSPSSEVYYQKSYKEKDLITITYKILYSNVCHDTCVLTTYFKSYQDSLNNKNPVIERNIEDLEGPSEKLPNELFEQVKDKVGETIFKIEQKDNSYILRSVKIKE